MATRATIKIEGVKFAKIYKHYDGYPEGMTEWLTAFNSEFVKSRGEDSAYKFAELLRHSTRWFPIKRKNYKDEEEFDYLGWGVVEYSGKCGAEYEYMLKNDGSVTVKKL